jgi:hypothetical protein
MNKTILTIVILCSLSSFLTAQTIEEIYLRDFAEKTDPSLPSFFNAKAGKALTGTIQDILVTDDRITLLILWSGTDSKQYLRSWDIPGAKENKQTPLPPDIIAHTIHSAGNKRGYYLSTENSIYLFDSKKNSFTLKTEDPWKDSRIEDARDGKVILLKDDDGERLYNFYDTENEELLWDYLSWQKFDFHQFLISSPYFDAYHVYHNNQIPSLDNYFIIPWDNLDRIGQLPLAMPIAHAENIYEQTLYSPYRIFPKKALIAGDSLICGGYKDLEIWNLENKESQVLRAYAGNVIDMFAPSDRNILLTLGEEKNNGSDGLLIWDRDSWKPSEAYSRIQGKKVISDPSGEWAFLMQESSIIITRIDDYFNGLDPYSCELLPLEGKEWILKVNYDSYKFSSDKNKEFILDIENAEILPGQWKLQVNR